MTDFPVSRRVVEPIGALMRLIGMSTSWFVDTGLILERLASMEPAAAAADAAEIARIVAAAQAVAERLRAAFAPDELAGVAARSAESAGRSIADQIVDTADGLGQGEQTLQRSGATLAQTVAFRPQIFASQVQLNTPMGSGARLLLSARLTNTYNNQMTATAGAMTPPSATRAPSVPGGGVVGGGVAPTNATQNSPSDAAMWQPMPGGDDPLSTTRAESAPLADQPTALRGADPDASSPGPDGPAPDIDSSGPPAGPAPSPAGAPASEAPDGALGGLPAGGPVPVGGLTPTSGTPRSVGSPTPGVIRPGLLASSPTPTMRPSVPSPPAATTAANPPPAASQATSSNPGGRAGQGPFGPGPVARRTSEEAGHRPADYLRSTAEGQLLLGPQPLVGPPVIGEFTASVVVDHTVDDPDDHPDDVDQELDPTL